MFLFACLPAIVLGAPVTFTIVGSGYDEFEELAVRHRQRFDAKRRHIDNQFTEFIVPTKGKFVKSRAEASLARGD